MLERIRSLMVVLAEGSVSRAAVRLRISQPALSRQIQGLEHEAGAPLLERGTWGVRATDLGHFLCESMRPVVEVHDQAWAEIRRQARGERSALRVGYIGSAADRFLNPALAKVKKQFPELKLALLDLTPFEQIEGLKDGSLDLAMVGQEGKPASNEYYTRTIASLGMVAAVPKEHPLAKKRSVALAELKGEFFVGVADTVAPGRNRWTDQLCRKAGFRPRYIAQAESITEKFALITAESAVALLPDYFKESPPAGVCLRPVSDKAATWEFLLLRQRGKASPAVKCLVDAILASSPK